MSDVVNAELLRLCERAERELLAPQDVWPIARALKSRLQAEAPTDAEVAEIEKRHELAAEDAKYTALGWAYSAHADRSTLLVKLRARTSQAEAQATTTAASVLTEDERRVVSGAREVCERHPGNKYYRQTRNLLAIIARLTVGAPAPAPTRPMSTLPYGHPDVPKDQSPRWNVDPATLPDPVTPAPAPTTCPLKMCNARHECQFPDNGCNTQPAKGDTP